VRWLLAQEADAEQRTRFPAVVVPGGESAPSAHSAWCYGDLGIAALLCMAADCVGSPQWRETAVRVALHAIGGAPSQSCPDAALCHGAVGVGHLFNRIYNATRDERFSAAARACFEHALAMRASGRGVAGFEAYVAAPKPNAKRTAAYGFLEGAAGILLGLISAATSQEPLWDRVLLLSH
jgi:lantibiotic modifying enzyme